MWLPSVEREREVKLRMEANHGGTNYTGWAISILEAVGCLLVFQKGETHYIMMRLLPHISASTSDWKLLEGLDSVLSQHLEALAQCLTLCKHQ